MRVEHVLFQRLIDKSIVSLENLLPQYPRIQLDVLARRYNHLRLFLHHQIPVPEFDLLLIHPQALNVAYNSWDPKVPHPRRPVIRLLDGHRQQLIHGRHEVGDIRHLIVPGDDAPRVLQIAGDRHPHPRRAHIVEFPQKLLHVLTKPPHHHPSLASIISTNHAIFLNATSISACTSSYSVTYQRTTISVAGLST